MAAEPEGLVSLDKEVAWYPKIGSGPTTKEKQPAPSTLTWKQRIIFGQGEIGIWCSGVLMGFFLNTFFLEVAHLQPLWAGNILLISQVWDAIVNPIIGKLTDNTNTRWGRRRPWLLFCTLPFAAAFFGLFIAWPTGDNASKFWYYLVLILLVNTFANAINTPYTALTSDLASTYDEATELTQARMMFNIVSGVAATFIHTKLIEAFPYGGENSKLIDYGKGYLVSGAIFGVVFLVSPLLVFFLIKERPIPEEEPEPETKGCWPKFKAVLSTWKDVFGTLRNKAYFIITVTFFLAWTTVQFMQNNLFLYCKYVLKAEEHFQWIILVLQLIAAGALVGWSYLSKKIGKQRVYFIGIGVWLLVEIGMFWLTSDVPIWVMYAVTPFAALGVSVAFLIPWSLVPDVIDNDELLYGQRREGVFYSLFVLFQKIGIALALSLSSYVLEAAGYISPDRETPDQQESDYQPDSVKIALRIMMGPVPAVLLAGSLLISWFYPLNKRLVDEIHEQLDERKKLIAASDGTEMPDKAVVF